ncbi:TetR/AcrR family transcriptional regulator [Arthrobacter sp. HMWF013]|uniref:TetR/AcrR family transcriptional regulator n=1 Tax=Arthrobacter sp. HMWF013 TaxID=2056849 RepID=UPI000D3C1D4C|nr:TetR/AcrR family transcriptional regulator [Arthrobacter sp. HMWF013]PTT61277.1 TetR/AcrR family transcriptional regulator [Arthrobacter sp. HMWF013]
MTDTPATVVADAPRRGRPRGSYAKTEARRREILAAAFEVFSTSGYRAGSLKDVADKVGLTQAGLLHHFPSKEALLEAVLTLRDEESVERLGTVDAKGMDLLRGLVALTRYNTTIPGLVSLYCVLSAEATEPEHPAHAYFLRRYTWVRDTISAAFTEAGRQGKLRPGVVPLAATRQIVALMDGLQVQWLLDNSSVDMPAEVVAFLEAITTEKF